ncbi:MAG: hypothetical protein GXO79_07970 [Chlorobi bacterium]|nr:hypothetical protein [Chlorobiota bacterium]
MIKRIFQLLVVLSFLFLIIYLYKFDYLIFNNIHFNYYYLVISVLFLWLGFFLSTFSWFQALKIHEVKMKLWPVVYSHGISVFAKYIPGKLWVILGRAAYVSRKKNNLKLTSTISLKEQLIYILIGLIISLIPFLLLNFSVVYKLGLIGLIVFMSIFLFSGKFHNVLIKIINRILKKEITIPVLRIKYSLQLSKYILLYWIVWIIAFYFFCKAININTTFIDALSFPISISFGVLAIIAPGGIGVREGIIATFLIAAGWNHQLAITASLISRLWFLSGEVFIFLLALFLKFLKKVNA